MGRKIMENCHEPCIRQNSSRSPSHGATWGPWGSDAVSVDGTPGCFYPPRITHESQVRASPTSRGRCTSSRGGGRCGHCSTLRFLWFSWRGGPWTGKGRKDAVMLKEGGEVGIYSLRRFQQLGGNSLWRLTGSSHGAGNERNEAPGVIERRDKLRKHLSNSSCL